MAQVTFKGTPTRLVGEGPGVGDAAPKVILRGKDLSEVSVGCPEGFSVVLSVPSLDTPVCANEAREFNQKVASYKGAKVIVVSMDLPFAAGRFCSAEGVENLVVASDFVSKEFGQKYGLLIDEGPLKGLLARAVLVIKGGKILYKELVPETTQMPDIAKLDEFFSSGGCGCGCGCG